MCPRKRNAQNQIDLLGFTFPVYHRSGDKTYVDFYAIDPATGEKRRKKYHLDNINSKKERDRRAAELISVLAKKLHSGWNPFCDTNDNRGFAGIDDLLEKYVDTVTKTGRKKTIQMYTSRTNILKEYISTMVIPIRYAYQIDTAFCIDFLDYILIDRDCGPRTRNNYRGWLGGLCEWMVRHKYLKENPTSSIPHIPEDQKKRRALTGQELRIMRSHLEKTDKYFLLACLMEYYTFIRPTELSHLKIEDISVIDQTVFVGSEHSKNKRDAKVGLNKDLIMLMVELGVLTRPGDYYLFGRDFMPSVNRTGPDKFNKAWVKMRKSLGWSDDLQFYSLKDSGIRDLANAEGIVIARDQARHTDVSTTNKYLLGRNSTVHEQTKNFRGDF